MEIKDKSIKDKYKIRNIIVNKKQNFIEIYFHKIDLDKIKILIENNILIVSAVYKKKFPISRIGIIITNQKVTAFIIFYNKVKQKEGAIESKQYIIRNLNKVKYVLEIIKFNKKFSTDIIEIQNTYNITKKLLEERGAILKINNKIEERYINYKDHPEILKKYDKSKQIFLLYKSLQSNLFIKRINFQTIENGIIEEDLKSLMDFLLFVNFKLSDD